MSKKMKLIVKTTVEITLNIEEDNYPAGSTPTKILNLEKKNLPLLLHSLIDRDDTKLDHTLTLTEMNGAAIAWTSWKEGPDED